MFETLGQKQNAAASFLPAAVGVSHQSLVPGTLQDAVWFARVKANQVFRLLRLHSAETWQPSRDPAAALARLMVAEVRLGWRIGGSDLPLRYRS